MANAQTNDPQAGVDDGKASGPKLIDCPQCHGSGQYVGLNAVEECDVCDGFGQVPA